MEVPKGEKWKSPDSWKELLSVNEEFQRSGAQLTLQEHRREFEWTLAKLIKVVKDAGERHFNIFLAIVGNCVNEDASLGTVYTTPGLADLLTKCLGMTDQEFIAFSKTEAYDHTAAVATQDLVANHPDAMAKAEVKTAPQVHTNNVKVISVDSGSDVAAIDTRNLNVDALRNLCKAALFALFKNASHPLNKKDSKGKGKHNAPGHMPWSNLPQITADEGLQLEFWPWGVDFPGQITSKNKREGIKCLTTAPTCILLTALCGETSHQPQLKNAEDPDAVRENWVPVMFSAPPPSNVAATHGHVLFANGTVEKNSIIHGLPRVPSAATTIKKKSNIIGPPVCVTRNKKPPVHALLVISENEDEGVPLHHQGSKPAPAPVHISNAPTTPSTISDGDEWNGISASLVSPQLILGASSANTAATQELMAKEKANAQCFLQNAAAGTLPASKPCPMPRLKRLAATTALASDLFTPLTKASVPLVTPVPFHPSKRIGDPTTAENTTPSKKARLTPDPAVNESSIEDTHSNSIVEAAKVLRSVTSPDIKATGSAGMSSNSNKHLSPLIASLSPPATIITPASPNVQAMEEAPVYAQHAPPPVPFSTRPSPAPEVLNASAVNQLQTAPLAPSTISAATIDQPPGGSAIDQLPRDPAIYPPPGDPAIYQPPGDPTIYQPPGDPAIYQPPGDPAIHLPLGGSIAHQMPGNPTAHQRPGNPIIYQPPGSTAGPTIPIANQTLGGPAPSAANQLLGGWVHREPGYFQFAPGAYHFDSGYFNGTPGTLHYPDQGNLHPPPPPAHNGRGARIPYGFPPNPGHPVPITGPFGTAPVGYGGYSQYPLPAAYGSPVLSHMDATRSDMLNVGTSQATSMAPPGTTTSIHGVALPEAPSQTTTGPSRATSMTPMPQE